MIGVAELGVGPIKMNTHIPADLFTARPRCRDYLRGMVTVTHKFYKPLGPHAYRAEVEISYLGQYSLEFFSKVTWPLDEDYTVAVRRGVLDALRERGELEIGGKFTLDTITVDPIHSCEHAFFLAAREATASILRLLCSHAEAQQGAAANP